MKAGCDSRGEGLLSEAIISQGLRFVNKIKHLRLLFLYGRSVSGAGVRRLKIQRSEETSMKIGVCAGTDKLALLSELGYDYFEPNFSWLTSLDEATFREQTALVEKYGLPAESYNIFFRGGMKLYAKDGCQDELLREIEAFAAQGFARAAAWGGRLAVIGSGFARGIPADMTKEEVEPQFARVLAVCGEAAEKQGMRVAVEPLSACECNYLHTVEEGAHVASLSGHAAVGTIVDFYHLWREGDDLDGLPRYADRLWHAHYARPEDRHAPEEGDLGHVRACAEILRKCPRVERISLECNWAQDFDRNVATARPYAEVFRSI